jgi:hypothetical protein
LLKNYSIINRLITSLLGRMSAGQMGYEKKYLQHIKR